MNNYLEPKLDKELHGISALALAHVGDAVFELMVRTRLCTTGELTSKQLHTKTVTYVSAKAQAAVADKIIHLLDEEEYEIYKRGRNAHVNNVPRGSTLEEYHTATGIETLFGYLYLSGKTKRLEELFIVVIEK